MEMETVLRCDCGFEVRAHDEAELIARVQQHALEAHGLAFAADEVVQVAFRAELDEPTWRPRLLRSSSTTQPHNPDSDKKE
jgi:predicted small metal-binding protein